jgi:hypothetical protein
VKRYFLSYNFFLSLLLALSAATQASGQIVQVRESIGVIGTFTAGFVQHPHTELELYGSHSIHLTESHSRVNHFGGSGESVTPFEKTYPILLDAVRSVVASLPSKEYLTHIHPTHHFW